MDLSLTGKTIAKLRKSAGLTQASLAEKLGVTDKAISKWERGIACPDVSLWNKLSILLDTDIESLIYGHEGNSDWIGVLYFNNNISASTIIYDKPLLHYLLSQFLLVGINTIYIVGECAPINISGINITVTSELNQKFTSNIFCIYGNCFIYGPNLTKHFKRAMSRKSQVTAIVSMKGKGSVPISVDQNRIIGKVEHYTSNQYYVEPFIFYPQNKFVEDFKGNYVGMNAETMARGMAIFNIDSFDAANEMANFVRIMENLNGEKIGDINEILKRRGLLNSFDIEKF